MKFRTEINPKHFPEPVKHSDKIVTFGSCFADNIADKLLYYKFRVLKNPFGVLYNPVSIANSLYYVFWNQGFKDEDLIFHAGEYHSFYHHGDFSHHDKNVCLERINRGLAETRKFIEESDLAILTFGTAYVYRHKEKDIIVSNCHKIPASRFERFRLSIKETAKGIVRAVKFLKTLNENIKIILTVSPVRHWKDGAVENQRSKATLLLAVEEILSECKDVFYFPSYEILMDDLRDYRFYSEDLVHPNNIAVDYIWEKFSGAAFDDKTRELLRRIDKIQRGLNHKPRNPNSEEHQKFMSSLQKQIEELTAEYPYIEF